MLMTHNLRSPARISKVNYLGYSGTMGSGICDYLVTDRFLTPPGSASDYAESFGLMPNSYQPHGRRSPIWCKPTRREAGLPEAGIVFCFNQAYKITPEVSDIWCRLLSAVLDSVLWLLENIFAAENLRGEAIRRGIDARRLVFTANLDQAEHLKRLQLADLVLDTAPFNAHTTASDALWAGVPLVTCPGQTFPSRVACSILCAGGLPELGTDSREAYFDLAYGATETARLAEMNTRVAANRLSSPLVDVTTYTSDLERLFRLMLARYRAELPPAPIGAGQQPEPGRSSPDPLVWVSARHSSSSGTSTRVCVSLIACDCDVRPENLALCSIGRDALDGSQGIRRNVCAPLAYHVAIVVIVRLDQNELEASSCRH